jgi:ABC-type nitrate/sulfonate/bicarbonate transport system substrate-binding protein
MRLKACLAAAFAVTLGAAAAHAAPVKLRIAWITVPASIAPILSMTPDLAPHLGKTYTVDAIHFNGSTPQITALADGQLDIAALSYSSFALAIQNAHMSDLRVIADSLQDGVSQYSAPYDVRKDGPIKSIADLKGKTIAVNVIGAGLDIGLRALLRRQGLEASRDYSIIEANFFNQVNLLEENKAQLITTIPATDNNPKLEKIARPLFRLKEAMGGPTQILMRAARESTIAKERAAMVDYFEDEIRAWHWYLDPKNRDAALQIVAKFNKRPAAFYAPFTWKPDRDLYHDPDDVPNIAALQRDFEVQKEAGFLKIDIDAKKYADLSIVEDAAKRLKH